MPKPWNWPLWLHRQVDQDCDSGSTLVELMITLAIASLMLAILASMFRSQLQTYQITIDQSEALQNTWIALSWLKRDLQATRNASISSNKRQVTLWVPHVSSSDRSQIKWRKVIYLFQREKAQLQRSVHGSYNVVAEGIVDFNVSMDQVKRIATITVASMEGSKKIQLSTKVWLRNLR